jgi:hypothetical protein
MGCSHARVDENEGEPERQLNFALGFYLKQGAHWKGCMLEGITMGVRQARGLRRGGPCRECQP